MEAAQRALDALEQIFPAARERLKQLLRFPSIGTDPAYHPACQRGGTMAGHTVGRTWGRGAA